MRTLLFLLILAFVGPNLYAKEHHYGRPSHHHRYRREKKPIVSAPNLVTANIMLGDINGYAGISIGANYERYFTEHGWLSANIGFAAYLGGDVSLGEFGYGDTRTRTTGIYATPGLRFHPLGNQHRADLSIGCLFPLGNGNYRERHMDNFAHVTETSGHNLFAAIVSETAIILRFRSAFAFGAFLDIGEVFSDARPHITGRAGDPVLVQVGIRLGGQF